MLFSFCKWRLHDAKNDNWTDRLVICDIGWYFVRPTYVNWVWCFNFSIKYDAVGFQSYRPA